MRLSILVVTTGAIVWTQPLGTAGLNAYGHAYSRPHDFTASEYAQIASKFAVFTVEKNHAADVYGNTVRPCPPALPAAVLFWPSRRATRGCSLPRNDRQRARSGFSTRQLTLQPTPVLAERVAAVHVQLDRRDRRHGPEDQGDQRKRQGAHVLELGHPL